MFKVMACLKSLGARLMGRSSRVHAVDSELAFSSVSISHPGTSKAEEDVDDNLGQVYGTSLGEDSDNQSLGDMFGSMQEDTGSFEQMWPHGHEALSGELVAMAQVMAVELPGMGQRTMTIENLAARFPFMNLPVGDSDSELFSYASCSTSYVEGTFFSIDDEDVWQEGQDGQDVGDEAQ
eukprot:TRINITY_DN59794_c0_g1_i1.p1 TRINITY_DN59794_c0_g1~~TRINITY_DN59794_c0_g1_i1.p1  ORF type:complete len:179 (+),score=32.93 TRINITY_DN59794_c0_g1_i1:95-631(+)